VSTVRASVDKSGEGSYLPVWSVDGADWRPVVMTRAVEENPEEFLHSMTYQTADAAFEVAKKFCMAIGVVYIDSTARRIPEGTIIYTSGDNTQLRLVAEAFAVVEPEKPDDGKRDSIA
jgi:hypothetical protein